MSISEIWKNIENLIDNIQSILTDFIDFFKIIVNFFPSPFKEILLAAITIILIIIIRKIVKG